MGTFSANSKKEGRVITRKKVFPDSLLDGKSCLQNVNIHLACLWTYAKKFCPVVGIVKPTYNIYISLPVLPL
jgi:hypothetical protein